MGFYVAGAGGLGREVHEVAVAAGIEVAGYVDELRAGEVVRRLLVLLPDALGPEDSFCVGVADAAVRRRLTRVLTEAGAVPRTLLHPSCTVAPSARLGPGSLVMAGAVVSSDVRGGAACQVQYTATVGHDSVLGDFVTVLPGANVSGSVGLGHEVTVGSGAVVLQGRSVGQGAFVGAGAVVTRDVAGGQVVVGVPARSRDA